ncbi:hypothetical protein IAQ61_001595 [Plenodomus lingam]|uniref:uncharacterized protein n=1 Tax=Leptosphaeria maculans TaxID=5022 RepID=UPI003321B04C|nr:hypothetical protein IAQ61_001595 [Plenodomus lingam]
MGCAKFKFGAHATHHVTSPPPSQRFQGWTFALSELTAAIEHLGSARPWPLSDNRASSGIQGRGLLACSE